MKVAAIQHDIEWENGDATRKHLVPLINQAASSGARLIAVTEMYATGFSMDPARIAEDEGGPNEQFLIDQAREHDAWLVGSIAQFGRDGKARNVAVLAGPDGELHRYAKIHPFSYSGEHERYAAGSEFLTVRVEDLRVSVFVCYDLRFADEFWALAHDTDLYVVVGQLARAPTGALARAAARAGDREPGLRARGQPGGRGRRTEPHRRQRDHRPARPHPGRGVARRDGAGGRRDCRSGRRRALALPLPRRSTVTTPSRSSLPCASV